MAEPHEEALHLLAPVWQGIAAGQLDPGDDRGLAAIVVTLPQLPTVSQVEALSAQLQAHLIMWEQMSSDAGILADIVAYAWANVAVARSHRDIPVLRDTLRTAARALGDRYALHRHPDDLEHLIATLTEAVRLTPSGPDRPMFLNDLAAALADRYTLGHATSDLNRLVALLREALALASDDDPNRPELLGNLAIALRERYHLQRNPADLAAAVSLTAEAVRLTPSGPDRASRLTFLADALADQESTHVDPANLVQRIALLEEAVSMAPTERRELLNILAVAVRNRYILQRQPYDLERQITLLEEALALTPSGPDRSMCLNNLSIALADRYALHGNPDDLERQITLLVEAVECIPAGPDYPKYLNNLGAALADRYVLHGQPEDLEHCISVLEQALQFAPSGADRPGYLSALGVALGNRYRLRGHSDDLERRIALLEEALRLTPSGPDRPGYLNNLANALADRYALDGSPGDLERRVTLLEEAVEAVPSGPDRPLYLNNLGAALADRYTSYGHSDDLERRIALLEEALRLTPSGPDRPGYLNNLGIALGDRYTRHGDPADLERCISVLEEALERTPRGSRRPGYLSTLGIALGDRYAQHGDPADLERRIALLEEALRLTPSGPDRPRRLNNLANALADRYALHGHSRDLEQCIARLEEAVDRTPSGPDRSMHLNSLGIALGDRYAQHGDPADLERCITVLEEAVAFNTSESVRPALLNSLGIALGDRYRLHGHSGDLERCIALLEQALQLTRSGPERPNRLNNLANALADRYAQHGNPADLEHWITIQAEAVACAGTIHLPMMATRLGRLYLRLADADPDDVVSSYPSAALAAFRRGVAALERMLIVTSESDEAVLLNRHGVLYDLIVSTRLRLAESARLRKDMATVRANDLAAYLAAERGKGRRTAALLATRAARPTVETHEIQDVLDEIARLGQELARLDRRLASASQAPYLGADHAVPHGGWLSDTAMALPSLEMPDVPPRTITREEHALKEEDRQALAQQAEAVWAHLRQKLEQLARSDPNYAAVRGFAEPQTPEEVAAALPPNGALVLLYPLDDSLACFVLRPLAGSVSAPVVSAVSITLQHTPKDDSTHGKAALAALVQRVLPAGIPAPGAILDTTLLLLSRALYPALVPLLPSPDPEHPPSVVLVPTGALHRLPLHALPWPTYDHRLLDGYAVSYATTADVLVLSGQRTAALSGTLALAPGLPPEPPIPGTIAQASALARLAGGTLLLRRQATRSALLDQHAAAGARWVLLATHGRAGKRDPTNAGLLLSDEGGQPTWLTAAEILTLLDLEGVEHLSLAACSTHAEDPTPGDRLAGLLRALLYRGARSVQATLWPVQDTAAALVSVWTWERLLAGETNKAAALRHAVQRLRRVTGREAAAELRRLAATLPLPPDDPAHGQLEEIARDLAPQGATRPFRYTTTWAPFVLHGAPYASAAAPSKTTGSAS